MAWRRQRREARGNRRSAVALESPLATLLPISGNRRQTSAISAGVKTDPTFAKSAREGRGRPTSVEVASVRLSTIREINDFLERSTLRHPTLYRLRQNVPHVPLYSVRI
jgi:hypothetical protein